MIADKRPYPYIVRLKYSKRGLFMAGPAAALPSVQAQLAAAFPEQVLVDPVPKADVPQDSGSCFRRTVEKVKDFVISVWGAVTAAAIAVALFVTPGAGAAVAFVGYTVAWLFSDTFTPPPAPQPAPAPTPAPELFNPPFPESSSIPEAPELYIGFFHRLVGKHEVGHNEWLIDQAARVREYTSQRSQRNFSAVQEDNILIRQQNYDAVENGFTVDDKPVHLDLRLGLRMEVETCRIKPIVNPIAGEDAALGASAEGAIEKEGEASAETAIAVQNREPIQIAQELVEEGLKPLVLSVGDKASGIQEFKEGRDTEEATLCRQSTLYWGLKIAERQESAYPIAACEGILVPHVQVFRGDPQEAYPFIHPFAIDVFTTAQIQNPGDTDPKEYEGQIEATIRTILRCAIQNKNDSLVLSASLCERNRKDTPMLANLYKKVLSEPEFKGRFKRVEFGVVDKRRERAVEAFTTVFG
jgi:uncharacterized protein (TIGR02452 family)